MKVISIIKMRMRNTRSTGILFQSKVNILFWVLLMFLGLPACSYQGEPADIIVEYAIPFAESGTRWNEVILLEKDDFGRQLYSYKSEGQHTNVFADLVQTGTGNEPVLVYILTQTYDKAYVYCYDDVCYMYTASFEHPDTVALERFKQQNDWDKPLNKDRFTAYSRDRELLLNLPLLAEDEKAAALSKALGRTIDKYYISAVYTPQLEPIYVLREVKEWPTIETDVVFGESYVFMLDDNPMVARYEELVGGVEQWRDQINVFKKKYIGTQY